MTAPGTTVSSASEVSLPVRARICVVPAASPRTVPVSSSTVATSGLLELQVISAPFSVSPFGPSTTAPSVATSPARSGGSGPIVIEETTGTRAPRRRTVITTLSRPEPCAATIWTRPECTATTCPVDRSTRATVESPEDQATGASCTARPAASLTSAESWMVLSGRSARVGRPVMATRDAAVLSTPMTPAAYPAARDRPAPGSDRWSASGPGRIISHTTPSATAAIAASTLRRRARRDRRCEAGRGSGPSAAAVSATTPMRTEARTPSHVAVRTTAPGRSAATQPSDVASATLMSLVVQTTARRGSGLFA